MRILYAYNQQRSGGGSNQATQTTIREARAHGLEVEVFTRDSRDLGDGLSGRFQAAASALYSPAAVRAFTAVLDAFRPDVVHAYELFPLVTPWILPVCSSRGIPVVMNCDDYHMTCPVRTHLNHGKICTKCAGGSEYWAVWNNCRDSLPESLTLSLYNAMTRKLRLFPRYVTRFIAPSEFTREWLIEHAGFDPARVTTVPPPVEIPDSPTDPRAGSYIAYAGRFVPEKGIATLVEAARLSGLPFHLSRNEKHFDNVELGSDVHVVVTRTRQELLAFYAGARMLVLPSIWLETFGLAGGEAMGFGLPVVASRIGALSRLVDHGVNGFLFEPGNAADLADKVQRLWNDPELCRRMGHAAREKAISSWTPQRHFERLSAVYDEVVGRQRAVHVPNEAGAAP